MFSKIRRRLTLLYTALMAFFLFTFVSVCFLGAIYFTTNELDQEIRILAKEETEEQLAIFQHWGKLAGTTVLRDGNDHDISGQMFYYVFDAQGNLTNAEEPVPAMRQLMLERISNWQLEEGETKIYTFKLPQDRETHVIMTARSILDGQEVLGVVYMGKNISPHYRMLRRLFFILAGLAVVFSLFGAGAAYFMAGRAMIPIKQSFLRQKEFVADASHELRTPLSVLLASVDVIKGDEENQITAFSRQVFTDMQDEIRKMSKIVSDLLTLARADVGVAQLFKESFDLRPVAEQIIRNLQPLASDKTIVLVLNSVESLPVYADRERLRQLILLLVDNAIKYTPQGGTVTLKIEIMQLEKERKLILHIADTGIGIALEHQTRIFERFYRIDKVRSREIGGTGLGLAIADWIVKEHGGTIKVHSTLGQGTIFTITLPM